MVLFVIALLLGLTMPALQSALVEQAVRRDAHQLALMVKTGMIQAAEQHRNYVMDLTSTTMALHPGGPAPKIESSLPTGAVADDAAPLATVEDVEVTTQLETPNQLLTPDPRKANAWIAMPQTEWIFQPGELCPASRVRVGRGKAWVEMSFNALTGNFENEAAYLP